MFFYGFAPSVVSVPCDAADESFPGERNASGVLSFSSLSILTTASGSNVTERARNLSQHRAPALGQVLDVSSGDPGAPREPVILLGSAFFHGLMFSAMGCLVMFVLN